MNLPKIYREARPDKEKIMNWSMPGSDDPDHLLGLLAVYYAGAKIDETTVFNTINEFFNFEMEYSKVQELVDLIFA